MDAPRTDISVVKNPSKLEFSLAYAYLYGYAKKILALAVINIQASLIFLARFFVSLCEIAKIGYETRITSNI